MTTKKCGSPHHTHNDSGSEEERNGIRPRHYNLNPMGDGQEQSAEGHQREERQPRGEEREDRGEDEDVMEEAEEAAEVKVKQAPYTPGKLEKERHEATHAEYRNWCDYCVKGRGL